MSHFEKTSLSNEAFQTLMGSSTLALAQDNPASLPNETRQLGEKAIDVVASYVMSCFPDSQQSLVENNNDWKELVELLQLAQLESYFRMDQHLPTVETFVEAIAQCAKKNPILMGLGAAYLTELDEAQQKECFPKNNTEREKEVRHATTYCYLLHTITHTIFEEPKGVAAIRKSWWLNCFNDTTIKEESTFTQQLFKVFSKERDALDWKPYFSAFGRVKELSLNGPMKGVVDYKSGNKEIDSKTSSGAGLSINILEAMMQDVLKGYDDNAKCGFELMMEPDDRKPIKGADNGPDKEMINDKGQATGIILKFCPLPTVWSNLYSSWNLCFCTNYSNYPVFFAKLLNPATLGSYHEVKGLYLSPRVLTLYMHLQYVIVTRAKAKSQTPLFGDWSSEIFTRLWGAVNKEAARQYQERLEGIIDDNYGKGKEAAYDLKRIAVRPLWATLSATIKAYKNTKTRDLKELGDDDDAVKIFEDLKAKATESGIL